MTDTSDLPAPLSGPGPRGRVALVVASAVDATAGARLSGGFGVEVATQYRGGRVLGVRLSDEKITVHIVAERMAVAAVAQDVHFAARRALDTIGDRRPLAVVVDDIDISAWAS